MNDQKHRKLRYYTSWEEAFLVQLWREHLHDISAYTENLPIFRKIAQVVRQHGIQLNPQEVRRRINSYRKKYLNERKRFESNPEYQSDWRLYALIDSLFRPDHHVVEETGSRLRHMASAPVRFERDPYGSAFLEA
ncbi:uncharacterized protein LOC121467613 [Drosophila elegans]|uniref:uncharacterized protein LOC121467613 n=1 Tax=Drosophila elegans TaxID=30023 RepID=UPI001BC84C61|nr:uncharacterized protein LOC121467613 [Drosophila elegans]